MENTDLWKDASGKLVVPGDHVFIASRTYNKNPCMLEGEVTKTSLGASGKPCITVSIIREDGELINYRCKRVYRTPSRMVVVS
jgi:hypothetical protein